MLLKSLKWEQSKTSKQFSKLLLAHGLDDVFSDDKEVKNETNPALCVSPSHSASLDLSQLFSFQWLIAAKSENTHEFSLLRPSKHVKNDMFTNILWIPQPDCLI